jgi:hypothetical protein
MFKRTTLLLSAVSVVALSFSSRAQARATRRDREPPSDAEIERGLRATGLLFLGGPRRCGAYDRGDAGA